MEFKKEELLGVRQYGVLSRTIKATDSSSPGSNFKILSRVLQFLTDAGMRSDGIELPEDQDYEVTQQTGIVSLKSTEPSSGIIASPDRTVVYQIVPDSGNILSSGTGGGQEIAVLPKGSNRLVVRVTVAEPIRLTELGEKAA